MERIPWPLCGFSQRVYSCNASMALGWCGRIDRRRSVRAIIFLNRMHLGGCEYVTCAENFRARFEIRLCADVPLP